MSQYRSLSYGQLAKAGFLLGIAMIVVGTGGEWAIHSQIVQLPPWEDALFFEMEVLGIVLFFLSPFVFGVLLPLVDS